MSIGPCDGAESNNQRKAQADRRFKVLFVSPHPSGPQPGVARRSATTVYIANDMARRIVYPKLAGSALRLSVMAFAEDTNP